MGIFNVGGLPHPKRCRCALSSRHNFVDKDSASSANSPCSFTRHPAPQLWVDRLVVVPLHAVSPTNSGRGSPQHPNSTRVVLPTRAVILPLAQWKIDCFLVQGQGLIQSGPHHCPRHLPDISYRSTDRQNRSVYTMTDSPCQQWVHQVYQLHCAPAP